MSDILSVSLQDFLYSRKSELRERKSLMKQKEEQQVSNPYGLLDCRGSFPVRRL